MGIAALSVVHSGVVLLVALLFMLFFKSSSLGYNNVQVTSPFHSDPTPNLHPYFLSYISYVQLRSYFHTMFTLYLLDVVLMVASLIIWIKDLPFFQWKPTLVLDSSTINVALALIQLYLIPTTAIPKGRNPNTLGFIG